MRTEPKPERQSCRAGLSFAPVGLDLVALDDGRDDNNDEHSIDVNLADLPAHAPKRRATRRVAATAAAAGIMVLLVAAFGRAGHRHPEPPAIASTDGTDESANGGAMSATPPTAMPSAEARAEAAPSTLPTTGTVRLHRPAAPNHVWLDGAKLSAASSVVSCGSHLIKVGARSRPRTIQVPCGAQIEVAR
ncbi:MAG: hypothetical protein M3O50_18655 [Myxococcota bacterium]|nr:hypothetical protein [Myxococcota bacterium]